MEIISMKHNCMGTMTFTLRIGKMKKAEEFTTYPIQQGDDLTRIALQSDHRWAYLYTNGIVEMSARRAQYATSVWFSLCKQQGTTEVDRATEEQLIKMLATIRTTASGCAGNNGLIYCDNSQASNLQIQF